MPAERLALVLSSFHLARRRLLDAVMIVRIARENRWMGYGKIAGEMVCPDKPCSAYRWKSGLGKGPAAE